jgi:multidrug resistance efflux pump
MKSLWSSVALGVVIAAALIGVLVWRRQPARASAHKNGAAVQPGLANEITLQGKIRPQHTIGVAANVPGFIETFLVEPGQDVYQGQVLARVGSQGLESTREAASAALEHAQEQVTRAENGLAQARMEGSRSDAEAQRAQMVLERLQKAYARQKTLYAEGATPRLVFEKAEADYNAAQKEYDIVSNAVRTGREHIQAAQNDVTAARKMVETKQQELNAAQADLAAAEVRSPVDGYVVSRKGEVGKPADEFGEDFFRIATDLYALEVELEPKDEDLKRIIPGMPALVLILDLQSNAMEGRVKEIKDKKAIVEFGSGNPAIRPGMIADVRLRFQ